MNNSVRKSEYLLLILILLLQACASPKGMQPTSEPVTLKVVLLPWLDFAPFFIAQEEGYFAEQGLQVEFIKMTNVSEVIPTLAQGDLDVGGGAINAGLLNSVAQGAHIRVVADKSRIAPTGCAYAGLMARTALTEAGELDSPAQLRGRRIVVGPTASFGSFYVEELLNRASLTLDDIEIVDVPSPARGEALEKGTIDLAQAAEPWVSRISETGHATMWMPIRRVRPDFQMGFVVFGPTLLDENPDAGKRFMVAYLEAVQQFNQGKTERNLAILAEYTGLDVKLLGQACWPSFRDDGQINVQSVLDFQDWAVEKGYVDKPVTETQFWDPSFIEFANQALDASSQ
jgi:NitT/TauT family transport system substrate-binding protein